MKLRSCLNCHITTFGILCIDCFRMSLITAISVELARKLAQWVLQ